MPCSADHAEKQEILCSLAWLWALRVSGQLDQFVVQLSIQLLQFVNNQSDRLRFQNHVLRVCGPNLSCQHDSCWAVVL